MSELEDIWVKTPEQRHEDQMQEARDMHREIIERVKRELGAMEFDRDQYKARYNELSSSYVAAVERGIAFEAERDTAIAALREAGEFLHKAIRGHINWQHADKLISRINELTKDTP